MTLPIASPPVPLSLRRALARGLARDVHRRTAAVATGLPEALSIALSVPRGAKGMARSAARLARSGAVLRAGCADGGTRLVAIFREARTVRSRPDTAEAFEEPMLVYTRIAVRPKRSGVSLHLTRVQVALHAVQRLVERGTGPVEPEALRARVEREAQAMLAALVREETGLLRRGLYLRAACEPGVWAGQIDPGAEPTDPSPAAGRDWEGLPAFSVRTFLSPDEMNPLVHLVWQGDPRLTVAP